jgi:hypothetical protein
MHVLDMAFNGINNQRLHDGDYFKNAMGSIVME